MAIIYSYPKANSVQGSDLVVITRFDEEQNNQARTMSANIDSIKSYIGNSIVPTSNSYGLYAGTEDGFNITNSTTELSLVPGGVGTLSVPANGFSIGDSFTAMMGGLLSSANNQDFRIRVRINSVAVLDSGVQMVSNLIDDAFYLNLDFTIRSLGETGEISSIGSFHYTKQSNGAVEGFAFTDTISIDTTIDNILDITFQWANANESNSVQAKTFVLHKTY